MSAYAMPGSFFLPAPSAAAADGALGTAKKPATRSSGTNSCCYDTCSPSADRGPLHERSVQTEPSPDGGYNPQSLESEGGNGSRYRDIIIAVKSASIDPVGLIQSITKRGGGPSQGGMRRRRDGATVTDVDDEINPKSPASPHSSSADSSSSSSPHDDAIQFVLSISFNGRKYTATRTLPRLVQLRNDLRRELKERGAGLVNRRGRRGAQRQRRKHYGYEGAADAEDGSMVFSDSSTVTEGLDFEMEDNFSLGDDDSSDVDVSIIPELPIGEGMSDPSDGGGGATASGASFAGRGFTRLQAVLRSYCPAIEGWLTHVADVVPPSTSPSLTKFLWEPLSANASANGVDSDVEEDGDCDGGVVQSSHPKPPKSGIPRSTGVNSPSSSSFALGGKKILSRSRSICTLDSINEDENDCDEESDTE